MTAKISIWLHFKAHLAALFYTDAGFSAFLKANNLRVEVRRGN